MPLLSRKQYKDIINLLDAIKYCAPSNKSDIEAKLSLLAVGGLPGRISIKVNESGIDLWCVCILRNRIERYQYRSRTVIRR